MRAFVFIVASALILSSGDAFARTAGCTCGSSCPCAPCTCGAGGSKGGKHHEKKGEHEHGGVGVGVNVDLGGVGQRKAEPNPFGTTNQPSASTTQEKTTTHKHTEQTTATTFDKVELTTDKAKDLETSDTGTGGGPPIAGGAINVSNDTPTPVPQTEEKKKKKGEKKKKKKWPKPIQDWVDAKNAVDQATYALDRAKWHYQWALMDYCYKNSKHYREVADACQEAFKKVHGSDSSKASQEDKDNLEKCQKEQKKLEGEMDKDFQQTPEGQKASGELNDAQKAADKANAEEKEAGKNIDQTTKDAVNEEEKKVNARW